IESVSMVGSDKPFPFTSVPGRFLTVGDICTRDPAISGTATSWDSFSYIFLMWHNLYRQIDAIQEALRIYDMPTNQVRGLIPPDVLRFKELCPEIFNSETPFDLIEENTNFLERITGVNGKEDSKSPIEKEITGKGSSLFEWQDKGGSLGKDEDIYDLGDGREDLM